jgi:hypothetical protein
MAGSIVFTGTKELAGGVRKYSIAWTSDASGNVSGAGNAFAVGQGEIISVRFRPGTGGVEPTNNYTVQLQDADGVDVLGGAGGGTNLSNTAATLAVPAVSTYFKRYVESGNLTPVVAAAGNAKTGTVELLILRM